MNRPLLSRRAVVFAARAGTAGSALMLALTAFTLSPGEIDPAGAAGTQVGSASVINESGTGTGAGQPLSSGNSETPFSLFLGADPECPGDSANDGYVVSSFMVPSATDLTALEFDPEVGPIPTDVGTYATFRLPLYQVEGGTPYIAAQTAAASPPPGPGPIINIPTFNLAPAGIVPGNIPAGAYKIGIACVLPSASGTELSNFWAVEIDVVTAASGGGAAAITWSVPGGSTTTTAGTGSTSTTASGGSTTSTTASGGSTTTTVSGGSTTSTTTPGGSTTSTTSSGGTTSGGTTGGVSGSGSSLPSTGSSPAALVMWAFFLVVCGRMAVVLSRPPKVKTPGA